MTREKALLEKKSPAEASSMVYPGVRGLEFDPTLHPEYEHKQARCVFQVLLGAWHKPTRRQPRALICFRRCLFLVRWSRRWLRAHALAFVTGHEGSPCACALYATCRTTFAPSLHLFCGTAAHERTWFRDASTSRRAFTSIASFPALAHDWALDAITHALPASAPSWTTG